MRCIDADKLEMTIQEKLSCHKAELELFGMIIDSQPTIKQPQWINCSERLPSMEECCTNDGRFLASDGNRVYSCLFDPYDEQWKELRFGHYNEWKEVIDHCVTMWMPLPSLHQK